MNVPGVRVVLSFVRMYLNLMKMKRKPMSNSLRGAKKNALRRLFRHARLNAFIGKTIKLILRESRKLSDIFIEKEDFRIGLDAVMIPTDLEEKFWLWKSI
jgi:hypothetical protein